MKKHALSLIAGALLFVNGFANNKGDDAKGGYGVAEAGYAIGTGEYGMNFIKINLIGGYKINHLISIGGGLGVRSYSKLGSTLIPLMAELRTQLLDNSLSPYAALSVGYSFDGTNSFAVVGYLLNPSAGVSISISDKSRLTLGIGYDLQNVSEIAVTTGGISFNVGISF